MGLCLLLANGNLMSNRRYRTERSLQRRKRPTYERNIPILVICEDSIRAPEYFKRLKNYLRLNYLDVPSRKSEGISLTNLLQHVADVHKKHDRKYGEVYIVFDKDTHPDFESVQSKIRNSRLKSRDGSPVKICAIIAIPCFEYWLLIHCKETSKPFLSSLELKDEWKRLWNGEYEKNPTKIFSQIINESSLLNAISRAKKSRDCGAVHNKNPWTNMDELVWHLMNISHIFNKNIP
jgi:RloB-like protein